MDHLNIDTYREEVTKRRKNLTCVRELDWRVGDGTLECRVSYVNIFLLLPTPTTHLCHLSCQPWRSGNECYVGGGAKHRERERDVLNMCLRFKICAADPRTGSKYLFFLFLYWGGTYIRLNSIWHCETGTRFCKLIEPENVYKREREREREREMEFFCLLLS